MSSLPWALGLSTIAAVVLLLARMERLVRERGSILDRKRAGRFDPFSTLLGLLVLGFCALCWLAGEKLWLFIAAGLALVLYGLGYSGLLNLLQGGGVANETESAGHDAAGEGRPEGSRGPGWSASRDPAGGARH